jgi:ABC-type uncharacterized transport system ATPase subunit
VEFRERAHGLVTPPALELTGIHKRFGDVVALHGASLSLAPGTVHALLGENGAGKTTLMRVAFGLVVPEAGLTRVGGAEVRPVSPADAMRSGIGMVQQHFTLVPALTTLENIALGWSSASAVRDRAVRLAAETGLTLDPDARVGRLSVADQQRVELLKALVRGARILILDEPTAALAPKEAEDLFTWVRAFRVDGGSVVLITHKLGEALAVADDITVLRQGAVTWSGKRSSATIETLVTALIGTSTAAGEEIARERKAATDEPVAIADSMVVRDGQDVVRVRGASARVSRGEIVGVAGVEGSGVHEFLYAMAGRLTPSGGHLHLPAELAFVPEDRQRDALLMTESVAENVALKGAGARRGWLRRSEIAATAARLVAGGNVRLSNVSAPVASLSGGNQQRLVLARELEGSPPFIVAINPTRGLDLVASNDVRRRLRRAASAGAAVLYHSADLDELLELADRIVVVYDGRVSDVPLDRAAIGRAMVGAP